MSQRNIRHLQGVRVASTVAQNASALAEKHAVMQEKLLRSAYTDDYSREERDELRKLLAIWSDQYEAMTGKKLN